jgi:hypothetical protein
LQSKEDHSAAGKRVPASGGKPVAAKDNNRHDARLWCILVWIVAQNSNDGSLSRNILKVIRAVIVSRFL